MDFIYSILLKMFEFLFKLQVYEARISLSSPSTA